MHEIFNHQTQVHYRFLSDVCFSLARRTYLAKFLNNSSDTLHTGPGSLAE